MDRVIEHLRRLTLLPEAAAQGDRQLLDRFRRHADELAFEALVRRHGPMVFAVCRRVLGNHHDAEDAFQATFLVLVRKSAALAPANGLANWLYGVAYRTSLKAKARVAKSRAHERQAAASAPALKSPAVTWSDLPAALDEELSRLRDKYRIPFILCELEGQSQRDAARQLGWPEGTLFVRLMRAKKLLASRLSGRGFGPSAGALAILASAEAAPGSVPHALIASTVKAATLFAAGQATTGLISAEVAALVQGVMTTMYLSKLKTVLVVLLAIGISAFGMRPIASVFFAGGQQAKQAENLAPPEQGVERDGSKTDLDRLQGSWWQYGTPQRDAEGLAINNEPVLDKYLIRGTEFISYSSKPQRSIPPTFESVGDKIEASATISLDPRKHPKEINIIFHAGPNKGTKYGIYRYAGDSLDICFGDQRPQSFSEAGNVTLLQLMRTPVNDPFKPGKQNVKKVPPIAPKDQPATADPTKARIRALLIERLTALEKLVDKQNEEIGIGKIPPSNRIETLRQLHNAELELCESDADRLAALKRAVERAKMTEEYKSDRFRIGVLAQTDYFPDVAYRLEMEIAYERAKAKAAPKVK